MHILVHIYVPQESQHIPLSGSLFNMLSHVPLGGEAQRTTEQSAVAEVSKEFSVYNYVFTYMYPSTHAEI